MSHRCPRPGCTRLVRDDMYACRGDWFALPAEIRSEMWQAWRVGDVEAHYAARVRAAAWYREQEAVRVQPDA